MLLNGHAQVAHQQNGGQGGVGQSVRRHVVRDHGHRGSPRVYLQVGPTR